jgi:hypothetical protein
MPLPAASYTPGPAAHLQFTALHLARYTGPASRWVIDPSPTPLPGEAAQLWLDLDNSGAGSTPFVFATVSVEAAGMTYETRHTLGTLQPGERALAAIDFRVPSLSAHDAMPVKVTVTVTYQGQKNGDPAIVTLSQSLPLVVTPRPKR